MIRKDVESSSSLFEAEQNLLYLVEGSAPLDINNPQTRHYWHYKLRLTEIAENGDNSVYSLIPLVTRVHANVTSAFSHNGIHTKEELSDLPEANVKKFRGLRNAVIEEQSMNVIFAIRDLAAAQMQQNPGNTSEGNIVSYESD